jgi:hypothetical protein
VCVCEYHYKNHGLYCLGKKIGCSKELQVSYNCDGVLLESVAVTEHHISDGYSNVNLKI